MSETTTVSGRFITLSFTAVANWNFTSDTSIPAELRNLGKMKVATIEFIPEAATDKLAIREGSATGPFIMQSVFIGTGTGSTDRRTFSEGNWINPYIVSGDCTFGGTCTVNFELI